VPLPIGWCITSARSRDRFADRCPLSAAVSKVPREAFQSAVAGPRDMEAADCGRDRTCVHPRAEKQQNGFAAREGLALSQGVSTD
jgi:hypothetical protein